MDLGGSPVVERIVGKRDPASLSMSQEALLLRVNGEYQDEDGDYATGFFVADLEPGALGKEKQAHGQVPNRQEPSGPCTPSSSSRVYQAQTARDDDQDVIFIDSMDEDEPTFSCRQCGVADIPCQLSFSMPGCRCQLCEVCIHAYANRALRSAPPRAQELACPLCGFQKALPILDCQALAPSAFKVWSDAATAALLKNEDSFVDCPSCGCMVEAIPTDPSPDMRLSGVPELDRTAPFLVMDDEGQPITREAMCHREQNRFRCPSCGRNFCLGCRSVPYHLGHTCSQYRALQDAIRCRYCDAVVRLRVGEVERAQSNRGVGVRELRRTLEAASVDVSWCVEKADLVAVERLVGSVCSLRECTSLLQQACTRQLPCGHPCGGVREERECLPCLEESCRRSIAAGPTLRVTTDDNCGICQVKPIRSAPAVMLGCGHVVHHMCAVEQLSLGYPGPNISFNFLDCPLCHVRFSHTSLDAHMRKHLELLETVQQKAHIRLKMEGRMRSAEALQPGGSFDGRPGAYAMTIYEFYMCAKCRNPYCGGERRCGPGAGAGGEDGGAPAFNNADLICGACCAGEKGLCSRGHGADFVEFKCRFCCSVASFFCFGTTHFCNTCHHTRPDISRCELPKCSGPTACPLRTRHPPNGTEFCLGCSMCQHLGM